MTLKICFGMRGNIGEDINVINLKRCPLCARAEYERGYVEIARKLWAHICFMDGARATYKDLADAIGLTDDELALCRRLENADA